MTTPKRPRSKPLVDVQRFRELREDEGLDDWRMTPNRVVDFLLEHSLVNLDSLDARQRSWIYQEWRKGVRQIELAPNVSWLWHTTSFEANAEGAQAVAYYENPNKMTEEERETSLKQFIDAAVHTLRCANARTVYANGIARDRNQGKPLSRREKLQDLPFPEYGADFEN
jgi:hypothetical protein